MACTPIITYISDGQALDNSKSIMTCTPIITYISGWQALDNFKSTSVH